MATSSVVSVSDTELLHVDKRRYDLPHDRSDQSNTMRVYLASGLPSQIENAGL